MVPSPFIFREEDDEQDNNEPSPREEAEENENDELNLKCQEMTYQVVKPYHILVRKIQKKKAMMKSCNNRFLFRWVLLLWLKKEGTEELEPQARESTDPVPKKSSKPRPKPSIRERSPRSLRNRQVARSITSQPKAKVHWNLQAQGRSYHKGMSPEQMKMEWDLHEPDIIQVHLDRQQDLLEEYPKWHRNWSLLMDPVGKGTSEVLEATVQHVRTTKKEMKRLMKTLPLDPLHMENGYTVLSTELAKQLDKQERAYQKLFLHAICGQGKMLNESNTLLDAVQDMGLTHREFKREVHHRINTVRVPVRELHPWDAVIQQTKLLEQEVPSFFQDEAAMKEVYLPEEEVLQTTTCSTRDLNEDIEGWRKAFTKELDSFDRLNVKTDVWESALDKSQVEILPGKVVMV